MASSLKKKLEEMMSPEEKATMNAIEAHIKRL